MLEKELNSGLQNNISIFIAFSQNEITVFNCHVSFQITYDLWDENYVVILNKNDNTRETKTINNTSEILTFLNTIRINCGEIQPQNERYLLQAKVLVNPVKAKRIKKIKNWIATSQGYTADAEKVSNIAIPLNAEPAKPVNVVGGRNNAVINLTNEASARPRFEKLFDKILQQYSGPNDVASLWSSETATIFVDLGALNDEN